MKRFAKILSFALLFVSLLSCAAYAHVYLKGSDVAQYLPKEAIPGYEKSSDVTWVPKYNKNSAIISLAKAESCDIAFSTWQLSELDDQKVLDAIATANASGFTLAQTPFVIDAIPPIVHRDNPVQSITLEQLHKIYTEKITKWNEIDSTISDDVPIEVYTTGEGDGKYIIWKELVIKGSASDDCGTPGPKDISPVIASDDHKWAIGFDSMHYIKTSDSFANGEIKILEVTNQEELKAGPSEAYPVSRYLYMITRSDISEEAQAFAAYLLTPDVQQLAYNVHQLPLPAEEAVPNSSSSSNCNAGFGVLAFLVLTPFYFIKKK